MGLGLSIAGILFVLINLYTINFHYFFLPKLLMGGITCFFTGIGFILFPGAGMNEGSSRTMLKDMWKESRILDRIMWITFLLAGVAAAIFIMDYYNLRIV